ncbi:metallophosphoesterase [Halobacteria archaeon HArc-gm2]|nr:metallophosphoesterase [Halobacteria archaeon HArc-gm2]
MTQTRVLHVSDTHLGKRQFGSDRRRDDFADAFEQAIGVAIDRDVDAVIHTGDLFDDSRPTLPTVLGCANTLDPPGERDIPIYGVVGAHERCNGDQWLDLFRRTNGVTRLGREPSVVGTTALYGLDAVRPGDWRTTDFTLEAPPPGVDCTILCMHELLEPPVDEPIADYAVEDVLDRVNLDLDGLALGGYHEPTSARIDGTAVWYAGSTERSGTDEPEPGVVELLEIDGGDVARRQIELETRPFVTRTITFGRGDGLARVRDVLDRLDLTDAAATIELVDDGGVVTTDRVKQLARDAGAAVVDVDDQRDGVGCAGQALDEQTRRTARNAIETAALRGFQCRASRETASEPATDGAVTDDEPTDTAGTGTDDGATDSGRAGDVPDDRMDEYEELTGVRERLDARMSERQAAIDELQAEVDALEADLATAVTDRGATAAAFLPADRPPRSVTTDTRDAVASHVETLAETLDVRSAKLARTNAAIEVEQQNAANARDDIEETGAAVDRLAERTDEFESAVDEAREELAALREDSSDAGPDAVADAAGRVEDLEGNLADLQADLAEERAELADVTEARDEAEAAIATLETERAAIEAEIDELEATIDEGEASMAAFGVVDELRGLLEARTGELSGLREEYAELQTEREALDAEIEGLTDDE